MDEDGKDRGVWNYVVLNSSGKTEEKNEVFGIASVLYDQYVSICILHLIPPSQSRKHPQHSF
jgi:hypothetical protein